MAVILAVEDNDEVLRLLSVVLERHEMLLAPDGATGLQMAAEKNPDLILLDLGMPDVDGLEVCRRLRSSPETAQIPVLFVTARAEVAEDDLVWQKAGADGVIVKPFSPSRLLRRVNELLTKGRDSGGGDK